jgi:glutamate N-acetyltransferase/amino-acid N-acetyltransferase
VSVTAPAGFVASGVSCGIKPRGELDLALVAAADARPLAAAGVFTRNRAAAAPVEVSRLHLGTTGGRARAVVLNSGNANAATGVAGSADARETARLVAERLPGAASEKEVLVCSTGLIGLPLPMEAVRRGVPALVEALSPAGGHDAARAILTTDTATKEVVVAGAGFTVGGMAKGAAMLAPGLATMLAVLTTDADAEPASLHRALAAAAERSFNGLSIDGCTSTNDTVIVLASGLAGPADPDAFDDALTTACQDLAAQMAADAEGATKVVRVTVSGAASVEEARRAARKVAESQLVKCSWYGEDPYWGRIVSELGSAGVEFRPDVVTVAYGGVEVCRAGVAFPHDEAAVRAHMAGRRLEVAADLGVGAGQESVLSTDLTPDYVDKNKDTS